jgi:hypothetical protein
MGLLHQTEKLYDFLDVVFLSRCPLISNATFFDTDD